MLAEVIVEPSSLDRAVSGRITGRVALVALRSLRFGHPKGGNASISISNIAPDRASIGSSWYVDDYDRVHEVDTLERGTQGTRARLRSAGRGVPRHHRGAIGCVERSGEATRIVGENNRRRELTALELYYPKNSYHRKGNRRNEVIM